jgi:hypothetical protein
MSHYVDRYWDLRRARDQKKYIRRDEFNCLDPDPRNDVPEEIEEDEITPVEIAALKLEAHTLRHRPKLSDEYGD